MAPVTYILCVISLTIRLRAEIYWTKIVWIQRTKMLCICITLTIFKKITGRYNNSTVCTMEVLSILWWFSSIYLISARFARIACNYTADRGHLQKKLTCNITPRVHLDALPKIKTVLVRRVICSKMLARSRGRGRENFGNWVYTSYVIFHDA
jgi:hypothetical protein